jgi:Tol biopolymer transport system component
MSDSDNIVSGDSNGVLDVFRYDSQTGTNALVSVTPGGTSGNGLSENPVMSADGRYVAFDSYAHNLVSANTGPQDNVYVRDMVAGTTTLVSVNTTGVGGNGDSFGQQITPDGRYVVFESYASDLEAGDNNNTLDIFVRDLHAGTTTLVSVDRSGTGSANGGSQSPVITPDGSHVAFLSYASDLVTTTTNGVGDVYERNLATGTTTLISIDTTGTTGGNQYSYGPYLSADGRYVVFNSYAHNLVSGDTSTNVNVLVRDTVAGTTSFVSVNNSGSIIPGSYNGQLTPNGRYVAFNGGVHDYVRDLQLGTTTQVDVGMNGAAPNNNGGNISITPDGRYAAFDSIASNLVSNDFNGTEDVFLRDLVAGTTTLVSVNASGTSSGNAASAFPLISPDGSQVVFDSSASDLVSGDGDNLNDVFVRNVSAGTTILVTFHATGLPALTGNGESYLYGNSSSDGRYVVFVSNADNLVLGDFNRVSDVFVRDTQNATTTLVSVNPSGNSGNAASMDPSITPDGRYVVFRSMASDLAPVNTVGVSNIFVRDLQLGTTTLVSDSSGGVSGNAGSYVPSITPDGRYVAFESSANNLVPNDNNNTDDVFVHDLHTGTTALVSVNQSNTGSGNGYSEHPRITPDGRYVVFDSYATDLVVTVDTNNTNDVFVRDLVAQQTTLVSVNSSGTAAGNNSSSNAVITPDGHYVAFESYASDLVANDANNITDVVVRDLAQNTTVLVSVNGTGTTGNADSHNPQISADGRYVLFQSNASDLVTNDVNNGSDIFERDLVAGTTTLVSTDIGQPYSQAFTSTSASMTPDGRGVAYWTHEPAPGGGTDAPGLNEVILWDRVTGSHTIVTTRTVKDTSNPSGPLISADGQHVVFKSSQPELVPGDYNNYPDVFLWTLDSSIVSRLVVSGYPSPTTAGVNHTLTVTAYGPYGNIATGYRGTVHFTSGDPHKSLPVNYTFTAADNGVHTFNATLRTAGTQTISVTDTVNSLLTGAQTGIVVVPNVVTHFNVALFPNPETAGVTGAFRVIARDAYNNTVTSYTGTVHFTTSDPAKGVRLPANYTFINSDKGIHIFHATLFTAGTQSITATDTATSSITGSQTGIVIAPAAVNHFRVYGFANPTTSGVAHSFIVHAKDLYGNIVTGYTGTVSFSSSDSQAMLPAPYTFTAGDAGVHTFSGTLVTVGTQTITASDTVSSSLTGAQTGLVVNAAGAAKVNYRAPAAGPALIRPLPNSRSLGIEPSALAAGILVLPTSAAAGFPDFGALLTGSGSPSPSIPTASELGALDDLLARPSRDMSGLHHVATDQLFDLAGGVGAGFAPSATTGRHFRAAAWFD